MKRAVVIALLAACSATPPACETCPREPAMATVSVCIDDAFTMPERGDALNACEEWTSALCGLVQLQPRVVDGANVPPECDAVLYRVRSEYEWIALRSDDTIAFCDSIDGRNAWIIVDRVPPGAMRAAMSHELGHLLGVDHGAELMSPALTDSCVDRRAAVMAALKTSAAGASRCVNYKD